MENNNQIIIGCAYGDRKYKNDIYSVLTKKGFTDFIIIEETFFQGSMEIIIGANNKDLKKFNITINDIENVIENASDELFENGADDIELWDFKTIMKNSQGIEIEIKFINVETK